MRIEDFDFDLPEALIALAPARPREAARLLVVRPEAEPSFNDVHVRDLAALLEPGDLLVLNDTKVVQALLEGRRLRPGTPGAKVSVSLDRRLGSNRWRVLARPAKRLHPGDRLRFGEGGGEGGAVCLAGLLEASVEAVGEGGRATIAFDLAGPDLEAALLSVGKTPLPPYIAARRPLRPEDARDYQTVYARHEGAVAAPTAGLHFSEALLDRLEARGIERAFVTLHVGAGTFRPVKVADPRAHHMEPEWGRVPAAAAEAVNRARAAGGRVVAVGTTSLRLLESAADEAGRLRPFEGETDLFITPGYRFRAVDLLLTNFHLPRSTLFMLVAAFSGLETMKAAYAHAIARRYRFYSYGDATLLYPARGALLQAYD